MPLVLLSECFSFFACRAQAWLTFQSICFAARERRQRGHNTKSVLQDRNAPKKKISQ
jgi:hypothetical protein